MVYNAGGTGNMMLFKPGGRGSMSFVAGQIAKTGDMKVDTPVATMGIRGTAVLVEITADNGPTKFAVLVEPDGTTGSFQLFSKTTGQLIATINQAGVATIVTPTPTGVDITTVPMTAAEIQQAAAIVANIFAVQSMGESFRSDPGTTPTTPGGGTESGGGGGAEAACPCSPRTRLASRASSRSRRSRRRPPTESFTVSVTPVALTTTVDGLVQVGEVTGPTQVVAEVTLPTPVPGSAVGDPLDPGTGVPPDPGTGVPPDGDRGSARSGYRNPDRSFQHFGGGGPRHGCSARRCLHRHTN